MSSGKFVGTVVVVSGGTGAVGSGIVRALVKEGNQWLRLVLSALGALVAVPTRNTQASLTLQNYIKGHEDQLYIVQEDTATEQGLILSTFKLT
jgi:uncharacterized protein YbjT (DUF2867 family)